MSLYALLDTHSSYEFYQCSHGSQSIFGGTLKSWLQIEFPLFRDRNGFGSYIMGNFCTQFLLRYFWVNKTYTEKFSGKQFDCLTQSPPKSIHHGVLCPGTYLTTKVNTWKFWGTDVHSAFQAKGTMSLLKTAAMCLCHIDSCEFR
jgi:hypothetical protein